MCPCLKKKKKGKKKKMGGPRHLIEGKRKWTLPRDPGLKTDKLEGLLNAIQNK